MREHEILMLLALAEAEVALAQGEFPVGCVLVHQGAVIASGKRVHSSGKVNEMDHAEMLALRSFLDAEPGVAPQEVTVYATMEPCLMCFSTLILNGIRKIVYAYEDVMGGGTNLPLTMLNPLYAAMEIKVVPAVLRRESLALFQQFFSNPDNLYWKGSLLASYTLEQK
ncbi:MAG: deaminase [Desulfocapsaceae bacterium]|jgi:tRNA(adenine34) deaminase|nr:deaminase [Desulfocapsaceae bacterium]